MSKEIGQKIRQLRLDKKLTQVQLGEMIGLAAPKISRYENGEDELTNETIIKFADALGVSVSELVVLQVKPDAQAEPTEEEKINIAVNHIRALKLIEENDVRLLQLKLSGLEFVEIGNLLGTSSIEAAQRHQQIVDELSRNGVTWPPLSASAPSVLSIAQAARKISLRSIALTNCSLEDAFYFLASLVKGSGNTELADQIVSAINKPIPSIKLLSAAVGYESNKPPPPNSRVLQVSGAYLFSAPKASISLSAVI